MYFPLMFYNAGWLQLGPVNSRCPREILLIPYSNGKIRISHLHGIAPRHSSKRS